MSDRDHLPLLCLIDNDPLLLKALTRMLKDNYRINSGLPGAEKGTPRPDVIITDWRPSLLLEVGAVAAGG